MSTLSTLDSSAALDAYEAMAPYYDAFTASYDHDRWLDNLEAVAIGHGAHGHRALDVGCGTGKSFMPLLRRGYEVTACDLSPQMAERARARSGGRVRVTVADMRTLPRYGRFDLVVCLDDALNYLLSEEELAAAFRRIAANLAPDGVFVFDLNSLATFRTAFASVHEVEAADAVFRWRGEGDPEAEPGAIATAVIETVAGGDAEAEASRHVQRHHPPELVRAALTGAGLDLLELRGQITGARLEPQADDLGHVKLVYFARLRARRASTRGGEADMSVIRI